MTLELPPLEDLEKTFRNKTADELRILTKQIEGIKVQIEKEEFVKTHACCPDVCKSIESLMDEIEGQCIRLDYQDKANQKKILKLPKEFRDSLKIKEKHRVNKIVEELHNKLDALKLLKKTLADNQICACNP